MNVHIDLDEEINEIERKHPELLDMMDYLYSYLDNDWTIKKRKNGYIIVKENHKLIVSESIHFANSTINKHYSDNIENKKSHHNRGINLHKTKYIFYFLYNVLNNGWTIKKSRQEEYTFIKNHEGKKEIFSNKYLHTFMKENFNYHLIK